MKYYLTLFFSVFLGCRHPSAPEKCLITERDLERISFRGDERVGLSQVLLLSVTREISAWCTDPEYAEVRCFVLASKIALVSNQENGSDHREVIYKLDQEVKIKKSILLNIINMNIESVANGYGLDQPYCPKMLMLTYRDDERNTYDVSHVVRTDISFENIWATIVAKSEK